MKKSILYCLLAFSFGAVHAQHITHFCGQQNAHERLCSRHPEAISQMRDAREVLEAETRNFAENRGGGMVIYTIPVVFHVIHNNGPENISNDQIYDAVAILNRDFRKLNADTSSIVAAFQGIAADIGVEFALAAKDPDGNCHPGINRVMSPLTNDGGNSDMKALSYWPREMYMNVWVCADAGDGTAGFTYNPGDVNGNWGYYEDGIVMRSDYVGSIGTSNTSKSRTLTHEVGHWLNLDHTWGGTNSPGDPANCNIDDNVSDTPNTIGHTSCNLSAATCGSDLDNVQNYMEYSYCSKMFTQGQANRMRAAALSSVADRNQLWTNSNLAATGVLNPPLCAAVFSANQISGCAGTPVQFLDESYHNVETWSWDFGDGTTLSGSDPSIHKNPEHIFSSPGNYTVVLTVSNSTGTVTSNNNFVMSILPQTGISALQEGFENAFPAANWIINNPNADETWEVSPSAATSGIKSIKLRNFTIDPGNTDEFISTTINSVNTDSVVIMYKWAYANMVTETDDRLKISVSNDCGNTWSLRKMRRGTTNLPTANATNSQFTPTSLDQWSSEAIIITDPTYFTPQFRVKFEFISDGGNNLFIDDINIFPTTAAVGVSEIQAQHISAYPVPADDVLYVELENHDGLNAQLSLLDGSGRLCISQPVSNSINRLDTSSLSPGLYCVLITVGEQRWMRKVVIR